MSTVIYGPQGCGKTTHKAALAAHFGLSHVIDDWNPTDPLPENTLALTNVPGVEGAIAFSDVVRVVWVEVIKDGVHFHWEPIECVEAALA